jgi:hypothetical protein
MTEQVISPLRRRMSRLSPPSTTSRGPQFPDEQLRDSRELRDPPRYRQARHEQLLASAKNVESLRVRRFDARTIADEFRHGDSRL